MDDDTRWWQLPRRLLELSRGAAAAAATVVGEAGAAPATVAGDGTRSSGKLNALPSPLTCPSKPTGTPDVYGAVYADSIVRNNEREEESDSSDGSTMTESESETDEDTVTETSSQQISPPRSEGTSLKESAGGGSDCGGEGSGGGVERPTSSLITANSRRPTSAPSPFHIPVLPPPSCTTPSLTPLPPSRPEASGSTFPKVCSTAAHALAQHVQSVLGSMSGGGGGCSSNGMMANSAGPSRAANGIEAANIPRWPTSNNAPSNTTLCQPGYSALPRRSELGSSTMRRVPPPSLMASPWWRNMEEQSPAFAAVSQRFHAIAHAQARERLAGNLARLAVLHEAEEATREQRDALRMALGMPALARWAQTKAHEPLPAFLLRTLAALLDLSVELVKHAVLMGWVLLGVFNRLLYEVLTANRSAFGRPCKLWS